MGCYSGCPCLMTHCQNSVNTMKALVILNMGALAVWLVSTSVYATGMVPETSVVIVEEDDGEGVINVKNTDAFPVLLLTNIINIKEDSEALLVVTPPAARVEPGKTQRVRFLLAHKEPLKTERLKRVLFDGVPPQQKGQNQVRMSVRQNLPVILRPSGLERDTAPWKRLVWSLDANTLTVHNPSPYVVRLGQDLLTLPDNTPWMLPASYILPGQTLAIKPGADKTVSSARQVRISPATTWGYTVNSYDADLAQ